MWGLNSHKKKWIFMINHAGSIYFFVCVRVVVVVTPVSFCYLLFSDYIHPDIRSKRVYITLELIII